jgi:hypothetical protein
VTEPFLLFAFSELDYELNGSREFRTEQPWLVEVPSDKFGGDGNGRETSPQAQDVYEIGPRKVQDGFDLISDRLRYGSIWYAGPDAVRKALAHAEYHSWSRSRRAIIHVFDEPGKVIEMHEHAGEFKERLRQFRLLGYVF